VREARNRLFVENFADRVGLLQLEFPIDWECAQPGEQDRKRTHSGNHRPLRGAANTLLAIIIRRARVDSRKKLPAHPQRPEALSSAR
jgi:hypothetical protein